MNTRDIEERKQAGSDLLQEQLEQVDKTTKRFLGALEGFRRDVAVAKNSDSVVKIGIERTLRSFIPPALNQETQLATLVEILVRAVGSFEGFIQIPEVIPSESDRKTAHMELGLIHENLGSVARTAQQIHDVLLDSSRMLYSFNAENGEKYKEANIVFDEDSLNAAASTARAIVEHAIRLDIEIVALIDRIEFLNVIQDKK
jgi:hypothetical protein